MLEKRVSEQIARSVPPLQLVEGIPLLQDNEAGLRFTCGLDSLLGNEP